MYSVDMKKTKKLLTLRNDEILKLREKGYTLQRIGDEYGITRERVRQILDRMYNKVSSALSTGIE